MAPRLSTPEMATAKIGVLPSLAPRPTASNIRLLEDDLVTKLLALPSEQSAEFGFAGMVQPTDVYALSTNVPWTNWPDPGPHRPDAATTAEQSNNAARYDANKIVYESECNVRSAINDALNLAVPKAYKRSGGQSMGARVYKANECPRTIIAQLRTTYGKYTPQEKQANQAAFDAPWNPSDPIEELFSRLEECYITALLARPAITMEQIIDKATTAIQMTGHFPTALLEWNGFDDINKTWPQLKEHFAEAYELFISTGGGTAGSHGYVNMAADDDSIKSIENTLGQMSVTNNANYQAVTDEVKELRNALTLTQQQLAMVAKSTNPAQQTPA